MMATQRARATINNTGDNNRTIIIPTSDLQRMNKIFGKPPPPPSSSAATAEDAEYYDNDEDEDGSLESLDSLNSRMSLESLESLPPFSPLTPGTGTGTPNGKSPLAMEMGRRMRSWRKSVASTRSSTGSVSNSGRSDGKKDSIICSSGGTPDADDNSTPQTGKSSSSSFRIQKRFSTSPKRLFKGNNKNANTTLAASEDKGQNHDPPTPNNGVPKTPMLQPPTFISKNSQTDQVLSPLTPLFTTTATTTTTTPAITIDNIISEASHDVNIKDSSDHSTPRADNVTTASFKQEPIEPTTTTTTANTSMNTKSTTDSELQSALESLGQSVKHIKELQGQLLQVVDTSVETDDSAGYNEFLNNISKADDSHEGPSSVKYTSAADTSTDDSTGYNEFLNISRVDSSSEGYDEFLNILNEGGAGMEGASDGESAADENNGSNHLEKKVDETPQTYYETMVEEQENSTAEKPSNAEKEALDDSESTEILSVVTDEKEGKPILQEEEDDGSEEVVDYESTIEDCQCFWPFSLFRGGTNHKQAIIAPPLPTSSTADTTLTSIDTAANI